MINDTTTLESLMQEWEGVKKNQQKVGTAIERQGQEEQWKPLPYWLNVVE